MHHQQLRNTYGLLLRGSWRYMHYGTGKAVIDRYKNTGTVAGYESPKENYYDVGFSARPIFCDSTGYYIPDGKITQYCAVYCTSHADRYGHFHARHSGFSNIGYHDGHVGKMDIDGALAAKQFRQFYLQDGTYYGLNSY